MQMAVRLITWTLMTAVLAPWLWLVSRHLFSDKVLGFYSGYAHWVMRLF